MNGNLYNSNSERDKAKAQTIKAGYITMPSCMRWCKVIIFGSSKTTR